MSGHPTSSPQVVLADTSFIYAVMDQSSKQHQQALNYYSNYQGSILRPALALVELVYLINRLGGASLVIKTLRSLRASQIEFIDPTLHDYDRSLDILEQYIDSRIDFVDACIMALAERLQITQIATYDRRDFGLYRPAHCEHFDLLP